MPDGRRANCRNCRKNRDEVGPISWRGYCGVCGPLLARQAADGLHTHSGPVHSHWRRQMAACVGGVLLDDVKISE